ncbi:hypothetical protein GCM10011348_46270 [Marinobacterium nitratireducens]|uniref:Uncharacterized protein n=1 Tax=Marinobacterium nitratireducens TaxID=518897 RepID=A0A918DZ32_9GAMM|nr:hypothetical protein [Marinobacterium nitratireducens]GGO89163.1 hypothetical protein GCM10011348_46270 [Marinobacterium nitratireducens]
MSAESNHWYRRDRAEEDRSAAVDARELAIAYKADAFREHGFLWVGGDIMDMDAAYQLIWDGAAYTEHCRAKNEAATTAELERLARECKPLIKRELEIAILTIAALAVDKELEAA